MQIQCFLVDFGSVIDHNVFATNFTLFVNSGLCNVVKSLKSSVSWGFVSTRTFHDDWKQTSLRRKFFIGENSQFIETNAFGLVTLFTLFACPLAFL